MGYLYKHIRLDTNEVFYIGIGGFCKNEKVNSYSRAYTKSKRSKFWNNITNKTEYNVEIIINNLSWEEACIKEIEFIKLYGRKDLNEGTLVNLTNGGVGGTGHISPVKGLNVIRHNTHWIGRKHSNETIEKMRKIKLGKVISKECLEKRYNSEYSKNLRATIEIDGIIYYSYEEAVRLLKANKVTIKRRCKNDKFPNYKLIKDSIPSI